MPKISLLSPEVFSRIAAGEVVENPAAVLKELIENALDAGAAAVNVEISGGGKGLIRVNDDGCGMDPEDMALCLKRHATSKIAAFSDLESLATYGFRGEALYAAASVSRLSITSRTARGQGWRLETKAGDIVFSGPASSAQGTTVEIRDLFYNTPARLKFLKSDETERARMTAVVEEAALANPAVHFTIKSEGRERLNFPALRGSGAAQERLAAVLGDELARNLVPTAADRPEMKALLFVSPPEHLASSRKFQWWFVNRRPVESRLLQQALYHAFRESRGARHPVAAAFLELPAAAFDVNVHPAKREIRFKADREVFDLVSGLVAKAAARQSAPPLLNFPRRGADADSALVSEADAPYRAGILAPNLSTSEAFLDLRAEHPANSFVPREGLPRWFHSPYRYLGQIEKSYLVFESDGGITVVDQHAAQERILFEKYAAEVADGNVRVQRLMLPMSLELPASRIAEILSHRERLHEIGFEMEPFGKTMLNVVAVPALFEKAADLKDMIGRLLDFHGDPRAAARESRHEAVAMIACKAAVKAHDALSEKEAMRLLEDLKDCREPACPHGRPALLALDRQELARRFSRPGAPPI
ncbi:MAG TPA: DNA mismatch repair endonuclease MutL [Elusimicrobiota bacterium]|nr:DNA mismatch repair endonuclease MutL [Elusimicrobiota bacterium]